MTLEQYQKIIGIKDPLEQLKVLGYVKSMTIKEANEYLKKEFDLDYTAKKIDSFKLRGRKFKLNYDIEELEAQQYALFKQMIGDIYSDTVDIEDNLIEIPQEEKNKKLFLKANKILAIFTDEKRTFSTLLKKKLDFSEKCSLFLQMDLQTLVNIIFFYSNVIENLLMNGRIYYMEKIQKIQTQE
jgi:hypothetical protein